MNPVARGDLEDVWLMQHRTIAEDDCGEAGHVDCMLAHQSLTFLRVHRVEPERHGVPREGIAQLMGAG